MNFGVLFLALFHPIPSEGAASSPQAVAIVETMKANDRAFDNCGVDCIRHGRFHQVTGPEVSNPVESYICRVEVTVRGEDGAFTREFLGEQALEPAPGALLKTKNRWSRRGSQVRELLTLPIPLGKEGGPTTRNFHETTSERQAFENLRLHAEFSMGIGFARRLVRVQKVVRGEPNWTITGVIRYWNGVEFAAVLEVDPEGLVRRGQLVRRWESGRHKFQEDLKVETTGQVRGRTLVLAKQATYFEGRSFDGSESKPRNIDFTVEVTALHEALTDAEYEKRTSISIPPDTFVMDRVAGERYEVDGTGAKRLVSKIEPPTVEIAPWKVGMIAMVHAVVILLGVAAWSIYRWRRRPAKA